MTSTTTSTASPLVTTTVVGRTSSTTSVPTTTQSTSTAVYLVTTTPAVTQGSSTTTELPIVTTEPPQFLDATLKLLELKDFKSVITPHFKPDVFAYNATLNSSASTVTFVTIPNSTYSYVKINGGVSQTINLDYVLAPESTKIEFLVVSKTGNTQSYLLNVYRSRKSCIPGCGIGGECNGFDGQCICKSADGYSGNGCAIYCPGACNGHGMCDGEIRSCKCDSTYTGDACLTRQCPICNNSGICQQKDWTCDCPVGWRGSNCNLRACPDDCNSAGDCGDDGKCSCFPGYSGADCGVKEETKVPLEYTVTVEIVFGLKGYESKNKSKPVYYDNFDLSSSQSQRFLYSVCADARNNSALKVRSELPCWIEAFKSGVEAHGSSFPVSSGLFSTALDTFFAPNSAALKTYKSDVGVQEGNSDSIKWTVLQMKINADRTQGYLLLNNIQQLWIEHVQQISLSAPATLGPALLVSSTFTKIDTEYGIIFSTVASFLISNGICLGCVLLFTSDWKISVFVLIIINFIVITLLGFLFFVMNYSFGAIEAVGVTIFVGMSVDYSLHLGHAFHSAIAKSRKSKIRDALTTLGVSILGGAVTTGGAAVFLLFCKIYLFVQLGVMMLMNTLTAFAYTLFGLCALLVIAGPVKSCICIRIFQRSEPVEDTQLEFEEAIELPANRSQNSWNPLSG